MYIPEMLQKIEKTCFTFFDNGLQIGCIKFSVLP